MQDWTDPLLEEKIALLFQTDTLVASGYFEALRCNATWEPGKKLMLAILRDAIAVFQENVFAKGERKRNLYREAKDWIFAEEPDWMFSFESICDTLGLDPQYVRGGLLRWSARKLAPTESDLDPIVPLTGLRTRLERPGTNEARTYP